MTKLTGWGDPPRPPATTAVDRVLAALRGQDRTVNRSGDGWAVECPAHPDNNPSLSIRDAGGRVLLHCHAGCDSGAVVDALGLEFADLYDAPVDRRARGAVREHPYLTPAGAVLGVVQRHEPKTFRPLTRNGAQWTQRTTEALKTTPYRLPEVVAAVKDGTPVYVVEGERDAEALAAAGAVATCNAGGAGKWTEAHARWLAGARVVVCRDRDEAGHEHAAAVAASLRGVAESVRLVEPAEGKDAADHLAAGRTVAEFVDVELPEPGAELFDGPPTPLESAQRPAFPVEVLPEPVRPFVVELAEATQTPADLPALMALGALGTLVGGRCWITARPGWVEPLNLWTCTVMASGTRKSPVVTAVTRPLRQVERALQDAAEQRRRTAEQCRTDAEARAAAAAKKATTLAEAVALADPGPDRQAAQERADTASAEAVAARQKVDESDVPAPPRLLAGDITPEAAASLLAEQGGRLGVIDSEGGLFGTLLGRYSSGVPNLDVFLKGFSGDTVTVDRQGRSLRIERPTLSLALAVQDDVLREIGSKPEARGRGLPARFLFAVPTPTVGRRKIAPAPVSGEAAAEWASLLGKLGEFPAPTDDDDTPSLVLDTDAAAELIAFETELEPRLAPDGGDLAGVRDWASKLAGSVVRLAGLLHLAADPQMPDEVRPAVLGEPSPGVVSVETMRAAITIGRWAIPHALTAFGALGRRRDTEPASALLRWIVGRADPHAEFTVREAWQAVKGRAMFPDAATVETALAVLVDHEFVAVVPGNGERRRGRPSSPRLAVNPRTPTPRKVCGGPMPSSGGQAAEPATPALISGDVISGGSGICGGGQSENRRRVDPVNTESDGGPLALDPDPEINAIVLATRMDREAS